MLVALVLLAVGVAGAVAALQAAARVRIRAAAIEGVASVVDARLAWFAAAGCVGADSLITTVGRVRETWSVARDTSSARMHGRAERDIGARTVRVPLEARRSCP